MAKNKKNGSLDTNVLLRLLLDDVAPQTKAVERLLARGERFEVADAALIEMIFVLEKVYGFGREDILENVWVITRNEQFVCNRVLFEHALPLYLHHGKLSIMDCVLLVYARLNNAAPLWTFDKDLIKQGGGDARVVG